MSAPAQRRPLPTSTRTTSPPPSPPASAAALPPHLPPSPPPLPAPGIGQVSWFLRASVSSPLQKGRLNLPCGFVGEGPGCGPGRGCGQGSAAGLHLLGRRRARLPSGLCAAEPARPSWEIWRAEGSPGSSPGRRAQRLGTLLSLPPLHLRKSQWRVWRQPAGEAGGWHFPGDPATRLGGTLVRIHLSPHLGWPMATPSPAPVLGVSGGLA